MQNATALRCDSNRDLKERQMGRGIPESSLIDRSIDLDGPRDRSGPAHPFACSIVSGWVSFHYTGATASASYQRDCVCCCVHVHPYASMHMVVVVVVVTTVCVSLPCCVGLCSYPSIHFHCTIYVGGRCVHYEL